MAQRLITTLLAIVMLVGAGSFGMAFGIPDATQCVAWFDNLPPGSNAVLFNVPNGTGSSLTEARTLEGPVDATIWIEVNDGAGVSIANYPAEDIWLEPAGMFSPCTSGTIADYNTDPWGWTSWQNPLRAGGWTEGYTWVVVNGNAVHPNGLPENTILRHNSPDINGDLQVDLVDLALFAIDYTGDYSFRSDLYYDGIMTLQDLALFAIGYNAVCP